MGCTCPQVGRASGDFRQGHANAKRLHASDEGRTSRRATLLGIVGQELCAFMADAVDIRRFPNRQALVIDARLHPADVITHDEQDVWLRLLSGCWNGISDRQAKRSNDRESSHGSSVIEPCSPASFFV